MWWDYSWILRKYKHSFTAEDTAKLNGNVIINSEKVRILKETDTANFKVLYYPRINSERLRKTTNSRNS